MDDLRPKESSDFSMHKAKHKLNGPKWDTPGIARKAVGSNSALQRPGSVKILGRIRTRTAAVGQSPKGPHKASFLEHSPDKKEPHVEEKNNHATVESLQQEQMLKLITRSFYKELNKYGVEKAAIITISTYLLDYLLPKEERDDAGTNGEYYNRQFTLESIQDDWESRQRLIIEDTSISPLRREMLSQVALWLKDPAIRESFVSPFPDSETALGLYFEQPTLSYFTVFYKDTPIGIIGADNIDSLSRKVEMRKFIGESWARGKGVGKRATFLFLYYAFVISKFNKVYIHSTDTNIRNINLNSKSGFELEGILLEDVVLGNKKQDVVRMGLLRSKWLDIFANGKRLTP